MSDESGFDLSALIEIIQQAYALPVIELQFTYRGWGGDCYLAQTKTGERYFVKISNTANSFETAASSRLFYLPLMHQLHTKGILPHIPHLVSTRTGAFSLSVAPYEVVITNFIEGESVGFGKLPENILARLAERVGILHRSRNQLAFEYPFIEQFEFPWEADLLSSGAALHSISPQDRLGKQRLRKILLPRWDELLVHLRHFEALQKIAKSLDQPMVICHTDLHGANLMTDLQGNLYILDWETALIAPLEHDMIFFAGEENFRKLFWPRYASQFPQATIHRDLLAFYYYRRSLEDVAGLVFRILKGDGSEARDREDINDLLGCLDGFAGIENILQELESKPLTTFPDPDDSAA